MLDSVKGELLFVDCVDEGGRKGPPVNEKWDENGATPPIRCLVSPRVSSCVWIEYVVVVTGVGSYEFISFGGREFVKEVM